MKRLLLTLAAGCITVATAGAFAADGMMMKDGMMMMVMPDGHMSKMMKADKSTMDMMMKDGKPMTGAHMMMMSGGKMYMMEDKQMANGKMMSDGMMMKDSKMK